MHTSYFTDMDISTSTQRNFSSDRFHLKISDDQAIVKVTAQWKFCEPVRGPTYCYGVLDLILDLDRKPGKEAVEDALGSTLETLSRRIWASEYSALDEETVVLKVILASNGGFVCRSDILDIRMQHSEHIDSVISLSTWENMLPPLAARKKKGLLSLLPSSAGAFIVRQSHLPISETLELIQHDLNMRLSFDWISSVKPRPRRMAVVGGRPMPDPKSGTYGSAVFFQAAKALGISLVVFDAPGHWLEDKKFAQLREDFVAMDMSNLEELPQALATAVIDRQEKIDGIVTFMDEYVLTTSQAASLLNLPTEPPHSLLQTNYKHKMREAIREPNIQVVTLDHVDQLDNDAFAETLKTLRFPMIVKPSRGLTSKGIRKVGDQDSLRQAVHMLEHDEDGLSSHGILIETYIDGPEFDANFVLSQGQILFLEVTDNFPCLADADGATLSDNFAETVQLSNTKLPPEEVQIIRSSILRSLLKLGFKSGVFHCEGRMMNSSMCYRDVRQYGIVDLVANESVTTYRARDVFLLEINVRPPGTGGTWATLLTYGVDLGALHLLRACNDRARFEALSTPFAYSDGSPGDGGGAQWWTAHCMVPIHRDNVRVPEDFIQKLYCALPEVVSFVIKAEMYASPGTVVSPVAGIGWIAYMLLGSRVSRTHTLQMYRQIAETSKKLLDSNSYDSGYDS